VFLLKLGGRYSMSGFVSCCGSFCLLFWVSSARSLFNWFLFNVFPLFAILLFWHFCPLKREVDKLKLGLAGLAGVKM
jgi:hypothetical protein